MVSFAKVDYQLPPGLRTKIATHGDYTAASAARIIPTEVGVKVFERLFGQPYGIRPMCDLPVNDWMEIREEITRTALTLDVQVYAAATNGGGG
jgi:hypothetical protein